LLFGRGARATAYRARVSAALALVVAIAGVLALIVTRVSDKPTLVPSKPQATRFMLERESTKIDRTASSFPVRITYGACGGEPLPKVSSPSIKTEPRAFIVRYYLLQEHSSEADACFGVGLPDRHGQLRLPHALGDRALISDGGKGDWMLILIPPRGRDAVRELGLRKGFAYIEPGCETVARYFHDHPKSDWCLY